MIPALKGRNEFDMKVRPSLIPSSTEFEGIVDRYSRSEGFYSVVLDDGRTIIQIERDLLKPGPSSLFILIYHLS